MRIEVFAYRDMTFVVCNAQFRKGLFASRVFLPKLFTQVSGAFFVLKPMAAQFAVIPPSTALYTVLFDVFTAAVGTGATVFLNSCEILTILALN